MVLDFVRADRPLTPSFIKELHGAITRTQETYVATDTLGRVFEKKLPRGVWKTEPNHVIRMDNTLLEYVPPEHVPAGIDRLVDLYARPAGSGVCPIVLAARLHHRFVQVHPFAAGNGRVARALALLILEKDRYAPLVMDRWHRKDYLDALDVANDGGLRPLIRLFIKLESSALVGELERPEEPVSRGLALEVAHTLASQLAAARTRRQTQIQQLLSVRATVIGALMKMWFNQKRDELSEVFRQKGLRDVDVLADTEMPPDPKTHLFRRQIIESAGKAGHYADLGFCAGWSRLRIRVAHQQLRFVASLHGAGKEAGVMAVTTFGLLSSAGETPEEGEGPSSPEQVETTTDALRFVHTEEVDDIRRRAETELSELLDSGLAEALARLLARV
jgi:hypothetical protein